MIPLFNDNGLLPPGIHLATLDEIESRFGQMSELRRVQMQSVRWMVDLALQVGAECIVLNGSFVTDIIEPNDVDCVVLLIPEQRKSEEAFDNLCDGLPFLDIVIADPDVFDEFVNNIFAADRFGEPKGMIEVMI